MLDSLLHAGTLSARPPLFFNREHQIRAHPCAGRAANARRFIKNCDGVIPFYVNLFLVQFQNLLGTCTDAKTAALAGVFVLSLIHI